MRPILLRLASVVCLVAALVLGWMAFTRFDDGPPPQVGSPAYRDFHDQRLADARLSVVLGLGASFALFGAFACHTLAGRGSPAPRKSSGRRGSDADGDESS